MNKKEILEELQSIGVLAVLRGPTPDLTVKMVEALVTGGVTGIEITYTTPQAPHVVERLDKAFGSAIVLGMGTVTEPAQAAEAHSAGARFLVSPHCNPELAAAMKATGLPIMMGALTPTEIQESHRLGSDIVKLFPGSLGGPAYMKAIKGPFPDIPMMPTGGVSKENVADWFKAGAVAVGAGSNLCPRPLALDGRFAEISAIAREFMAAVQAARIHK